MTRRAVSVVAALLVGGALAAALHRAPSAAALTVPTLTLPTLLPTTTAPPVVAPPPPGPQSADYGYDATHDFAAADPTVTLPLGARWAQTAPGDVVALLAADGVDFALVDMPDAAHAAGASIEGRDPASGAIVWSKPAPVGASIAYGSAILAMAGNGMIQAFRYGTGAPAWSVPMVGVTSVTAADGEFYADAPNRVEAINATSGKVDWSAAPPISVGGGPLAIAGNRVYRATSTRWQAYDRLTGQLIWQQSTASTGGDPETPVLWQNELFRVGYTPGSSLPGTALDGGAISDATGAAIAGQSAEIVSGNVGLQTHGTSVIAADLNTGTTFWSSLAQPLGILNDDAITTAAGSLQLRNLTTGALDWTARPTSPQAAYPTAVGNQELLIGDGRQIVALVASKYARMTAHVALKTAYAVYGGAPATGTATITEPGIQLVQSLRIAAEPWPFKRFGPATTLKPDPDGNLQLIERPALNTVYALLAPGSTTVLARFEIIALPRVLYRFGTPSSAQENVTVKVTIPGTIRLAHHGISVYIVQSKQKRYRWVGSGTLSGSTGRFVATIQIPAADHIGPHVPLITCITGLGKQGMGFGGRLDRRCGAKQIGF